MDLSFVPKNEKLFSWRSASNFTPGLHCFYPIIRSKPSGLTVLVYFCEAAVLLNLITVSGFQHIVKSNWKSAYFGAGLTLRSMAIVQSRTSEAVILCRLDDS